VAMTLDPLPSQALTLVPVPELLPLEPPPAPGAVVVADEESDPV
jgi:hypothetical protein